jgi:serine/threonine-protein kinase RsbW
VTAQQIIFRLTMASDPKNIGRIEKFLAKISRNVPMDDIQLHKLMVSLTEAVNNAIIHGNKADPRKKVALQCELLPGWLLIMVNDEGRGFKPGGLKNPLKRENLMRENGRGIFLMRTLMDRVEFGKIKSGYQVRLWLDLKK